MKFKQETRETPLQNDKRKPFARFKEAMERHSKVVVAALAVTFAVNCGPGTSGEDGGPDSGQVDGGTTDTGTDTGTDSGTPGSLCTQYGAGSPNRITLTLGQETKAGSEECTTKMVFLGVIGEGPDNLARFGNYKPPQTYPLGYGDLGVGEQQTVYFYEVGNTTIEPCEISEHACSINPATHTTSGDTTCTVTVAGSRPWVAP